MAKKIPPEGYALLNTIAGTESRGAYNIIYGGTRFTDDSDHPRINVKIKSGPNKGKYSSAAGKYQFVKGTWDAMKKKHNLPDFSPESQDIAAWELAKEEYKNRTGRDLEIDLKDDKRLPAVGKALRHQWTSLPSGIEAGTTKAKFTKAFKQNLAKNPNGLRPPATIDGKSEVATELDVGGLNAAGKAGAGGMVNGAEGVPSIALPRPRPAPPEKKSKVRVVTVNTRGEEVGDMTKAERHARLMAQQSPDPNRNTGKTVVGSMVQKAAADAVKQAIPVVQAGAQTALDAVTSQAGALKDNAGNGFKSVLSMFANMAMRDVPDNPNDPYKAVTPPSINKGAIQPVDMATTRAEQATARARQPSAPQPKSPTRVIIPSLMKSVEQIGREADNGRVSGYRAVQESSYKPKSSAAAPPAPPAKRDNRAPNPAAQRTQTVIQKPDGTTRPVQQAPGAPALPAKTPVGHPSHNAPTMADTRDEQRQMRNQSKTGLSPLGGALVATGVANGTLPLPTLDLVDPLPAPDPLVPDAAPVEVQPIRVKTQPVQRTRAPAPKVPQRRTVSAPQMKDAGKKIQLSGGSTQTVGERRNGSNRGRTTTNDSWFNEVTGNT